MDFYCILLLGDLLRGLYSVFVIEADLTFVIKWGKKVGRDVDIRTQTGLKYRLIMSASAIWYMVRRDTTTRLSLPHSCCIIFNFYSLNVTLLIGNMTASHNLIFLFLNSDFLFHNCDSIWIKTFFLKSILNVLSYLFIRGRNGPS